MSLYVNINKNSKYYDGQRFERPMPFSIAANSYMILANNNCYALVDVDFYTLDREGNYQPMEDYCFMWLARSLGECIEYIEDMREIEPEYLRNTGNYKGIKDKLTRMLAILEGE